MLILITEQELAEHKDGLLKGYDTAAFIADSLSTKRLYAEVPSPKEAEGKSAPPKKQSITEQLREGQEKVEAYKAAKAAEPKTNKKHNKEID
jgi:hypothetical protein